MKSQALLFIRKNKNTQKVKYPPRVKAMSSSEKHTKKSDNLKNGF